MAEPRRNNLFPLKAIFVLVLIFLGTEYFLGRFQIFDVSLPTFETSEKNEFAHRQDYKDILQLQNAFIRNAKIIKPTVVSINKILDDHEPVVWPDSPSHPSQPWYFSLKEWMINSVSKARYRIENVGSGVILNSKGYVLTNHHVIKDISRIMVRMSGGKDYFAELVGSDPLTDLAVLKFSTFRNIPFPDFAESQNMGVGDWVMAIGNPYGLEGTVTVGVISGMGRSNLGIVNYENFIQTDASINPGNSGGPLINLNGEVIGINTAVAEIGSGVGFAIPIEMAMRVASQLINSGEVKRGWLGIGIQSLTPGLASSFNLKHPVSGVLVNSVDPETPAEIGGIVRGDIIVQFDGKGVPSSNMFQQMVADTTIGKTVSIRVIRDGGETFLKVKIGRLGS
jgi:S1-C subfamily serine protease